MRVIGADLPLSQWLEAISAEISHTMSEHPKLGFELDMLGAAKFVDVLRRASREAAMLERRADAAPPLPMPDNVVPLFRLAPRPEGGAA